MKVFSTPYHKLKCDHGEYRLRLEKNSEYTQLFFNALIPHKGDVFAYAQQYYRCFMRNAPVEYYPVFNI